MGGRPFRAGGGERLASTHDLCLWSADSCIYLFLVQEGMPKRQKTMDGDLVDCIPGRISGRMLYVTLHSGMVLANKHH